LVDTSLAETAMLWLTHTSYDVRQIQSVVSQKKMDIFCHLNTIFSVTKFMWLNG
jgi:hypothetical protein